MHRFDRIDACLTPVSPQVTQAHMATVASSSSSLSPPSPWVPSEGLAPVHTIWREKSHPEEQARLTGARLVSYDKHGIILNRFLFWQHSGIFSCNREAVAQCLGEAGNHISETTLPASCICCGWPRLQLMRDSKQSCVQVGGWQHSFSLSQLHPFTSRFQLLCSNFQSSLK